MLCIVKLCAQHLLKHGLPNKLLSSMWTVCKLYNPHWVAQHLWHYLCSSCYFCGSARYTYLPDLILPVSWATALSVFSAGHHIYLFYLPDFILLVSWAAVHCHPAKLTAHICPSNLPDFILLVSWAAVHGRPHLMLDEYVGQHVNYADRAWPVIFEFMRLSATSDARYISQLTSEWHWPSMAGGLFILHVIHSVQVQMWPMDARYTDMWLTRPVSGPKCDQ